MAERTDAQRAARRKYMKDYNAKKRRERREKEVDAEVNDLVIQKAAKRLAKSVEEDYGGINAIGEALGKLTALVEALKVAGATEAVLAWGENASILISRNGDIKLLRTAQQ